MKQKVEKAAKNLPVNIVLIGSGNVPLGVYREIAASRKTELGDGRLKITVVSGVFHHLNYGWMPECLSGMLPTECMVTPVKLCFEKAEIIYGKAMALKNDSQSVLVAMVSGETVEIRYDHLVIDHEYFNEDLSDHKTSCGFMIRSAVDITRTTGQLRHLVKQAANAGDPVTAARLLRIAVGGEGLSAIDMAAGLAISLQKLTVEYGVTAQPTIYLVSKSGLLPAGSAGSFSRLSAAFPVAFAGLGINLVSGKSVIRANTDGAVLHDGSFIPCSLVYCTRAIGTPGVEDNLRVDLFPQRMATTDGFCRVDATQNTWLSGISQFSEGVEMPAPSQYIHEIQKGIQIGSNILRAIDRRRLRKMTIEPGNVFGCLGHKTGLAFVNGIAFTGRTGWLLRLLWLIYFTYPLNRKICTHLHLRALFRGNYGCNFFRRAHLAVRLYQFRQLQQFPT